MISIQLCVVSGTYWNSFLNYSLWRSLHKVFMIVENAISSIHIQWIRKGFFLRRQHQKPKWIIGTHPLATFSLSVIAYFSHPNVFKLEPFNETPCCLIVSSFVCSRPFYSNTNIATSVCVCRWKKQRVKRRRIYLRRRLHKFFLA